ncbi:hypothetical protein SESBI_46606 [Sesbania bispinosa]|nr:hypothetical protein SESBI_46606 [Sesbania bispinosa]
MEKASKKYREIENQLRDVEHSKHSVRTSNTWSCSEIKLQITNIKHITASSHNDIVANLQGRHRRLFATSEREGHGRSREPMNTEARRCLVKVGRLSLSPHRSRESH